MGEECGGTQRRPCLEPPSMTQLSEIHSTLYRLNEAVTRSTKR